MTPQERAEAILRQLGYPLPPLHVRFIAACIRAAVNDKLEETAGNIEGLAGSTDIANAARLVRAMKVT